MLLRSRSRCSNPFPLRPGPRLGGVRPTRAAVVLQRAAPPGQAVGGAAGPAGDLPEPPTGSRWYKLLDRTADFELWVIQWPHDTGLILHDHGGSAGAFYVTGGVLEETSTNLPGLRLHRRLLSPYRGKSFGPEYVHSVRNPRTMPATWVHAYSPPLGSQWRFTSNRGPAWCQSNCHRVGRCAVTETAVTRQDEGPDNRTPLGKSYASRVDELLDKERSGYHRVSPREAARIWAGGGLLVDTRPVAQRAESGEIPGAISIERNVLEWRLDPTSPDRHEQVGGPDQDIVVFCQAGYASSLAVASLCQLGLSRVTDLVGGYEAWLATGLPTTLTTKRPRLNDGGHEEVVL